jgi:hypothetical protein
VLVQPEVVVSLTNVFQHHPCMLSTTRKPRRRAQIGGHGAGGALVSRWHGVVVMA